MDNIPIQRILNNPALKDLLPYGSSLRNSLLKIRFRHNKSLRILACTYHKPYSHNGKTVNKSTCSCTDAHYTHFKNDELGHIITSDIHILNQYPDLQLFLQKGTAYKQSFCTDIRSNKTILTDLLKGFIHKQQTGTV
jgi:hypothetical protein